MTGILALITVLAGAASIQLERGHLAEHIWEEAGCPEPVEPPTLDSVEYFDFDGDKRDEAVVTTATCSATGGEPDVHAVFFVDSKAQLRQITIEDPPSDLLEGLLGKRSHSLGVENGKLVAKYKDTSGRLNPLTLFYRYAKGRFDIDAKRTSPIFPTSFKCEAATKEIERGICRVESLAVLDRKADEKYRALFAKVSELDRSLMKSELREWTDKRDAVVIDRGWVDDVTQLYDERIRALDLRATASSTKR